MEIHIGTMGWSYDFWLESAAHIIVAHNHPSGDSAPSREDVDITKKLVETGKIMGIDVLDHVIIGDGRHFSMKEAGHNMSRAKYFLYIQTYIFRMPNEHAIKSFKYLSCAR